MGGNTKSSQRKPSQSQAQTTVSKKLTKSKPAESSDIEPASTSSESSSSIKKSRSLSKLDNKRGGQVITAENNSTGGKKGVNKRSMSVDQSNKYATRPPLDTSKIIRSTLSDSSSSDSDASK